MTGRKEAILAAAITTIARHGVRGMRVEEVASRAGVAVSLIYYHFESRSGLLAAALDRANEIAVENIADTFDRELTGYEQLVEILEAELAEEESVREISTVWGEVLASAVFDSRPREQIRNANEKWTALVTEVIVRGQHDGSLPARIDASRAAEALTVFLDGLSSRWLAGLIDREAALGLLRLAVDSVFDPTIAHSES